MSDKKAGKGDSAGSEEQSETVRKTGQGAVRKPGPDGEIGQPLPLGSKDTQEDGQAGSKPGK